MKSGNINLYGYKLNILVENENILRLTFDNIESFQCLDEEQTKEWQYKIDTNNFTFKFSGTEFQIAVWKALLDIPSGTTTNYQNIANKIGKPKAVRAVANAVGKNRIGILVPCHRVVRSDGKLGGYYWGESIKRDLLIKEGVAF